MTKLTNLVYILSFLPAISAFGMEPQRVFVSTPISGFPKKTVRDCATQFPLALAMETSVDEAMSKLLSSRLSSAPVVDTSRRVVGIVSSFDFLQKEAFEGALLPVSGSREDVGFYAAAAQKIVAQNVEDVMTPNPVTIMPTASMREAALAMTEHKLHSLPVVDEENVLLGVILAADVMQDLLHVVRNLPPAGEFIEDLSS